MLAPPQDKELRDIRGRVEDKEDELDTLRKAGKNLRERLDEKEIETRGIMERVSPSPFLSTSLRNNPQRNEAISSLVQHVDIYEHVSPNRMISHMSLFFPFCLLIFALFVRNETRLNSFPGWRTEPGRLLGVGGVVHVL